MNISLSLLQEIVNYLSQRPYSEVVNLLVKIEKEYNVHTQIEKKD